MSGRPKGAPAGPEEEREQLRQLTRELHEAAQDARAAAREVREARRNLSETADAIALEANRQIVARLEEWGDEQMRLLAEDVKRVETTLMNRFAELAGTTNAEELMTAVTGQITRSAETFLHEAWKKQATKLVGTHGA